MLGVEDSSLTVCSLKCRSISSVSVLAEAAQNFRALGCASPQRRPKHWRPAP